MPHDRLQEFVIIDYTKQMVILAVIKGKGILWDKYAASIRLYLLRFYSFILKAVKRGNIVQKLVTKLLLP